MYCVLGALGQGRRTLGPLLGHQLITYNPGHQLITYNPGHQLITYNPGQISLKEEYLLKGVSSKNYAEV